MSPLTWKRQHILIALKQNVLITNINYDPAFASFVSFAAFSSCNLRRDGGGLGTMLRFHERSIFLDNRLLIPCSISLSLRTVSIRAILFRIRPNSLNLSSCLVAFLIRSMRSSPLRSITSSLICSVVFVLIALSSSSPAEPVPSKGVRQAILDALFNGTSPFAGFPPEHARALLRPRRIKGWGSTGTVFERLIKEVRPRTIVELGTFLGASALHMAALARDLGLDTQILCVDDFRGWPGFRQKFRDIQILNGDVMLFYQFMQNVASMNLTGNVVPVPYSTAGVLRALCEWGIYADLVEVDAGHDFHSAWSDINAAYAILRPGGVMFGHDYHTMMDNRGVRRAVNLFAKLRKLRVEPDGQHWVLRPLP